MIDHLDYVLGTHDEELERLGVQHHAWRQYAHAAWKRAGFARGHTLIDLGAGPGFASLDLAELVGAAGRVVAVERSRRFLARLEEEKRRRSLTQLEILQADLDESLPLVGGADGLWCRWVAAFVRNPRILVDRIRSAVRVGGTVVFHEYSEYATWRLMPENPELTAFVAEVMRSWRADGGEPNIGRSLPGWLTEAGFEVTSIRPIVEVVTPQDPMWQWPRAFVRTGSARLRELGIVDERTAERTWTSFVEAEQRPATWLITPTVLEVIARKAER